MLKILHSEKHIFTDEECRSAGKAGLWWDDPLAVAIVAKPPGAVQETLNVLEEYKGDYWCDVLADRIRRKFCSTCHLVFYVDCTLFRLNCLVERITNCIYM